LTLGPSSSEDDGLMAQAVEVIGRQTTKEWMTVFDAMGVPAGPIRFAEELWDDEQVLANEMAVEVEHPLVGMLKMASPLAKMSDTPTRAASASPTLGQHTEEVLRELGYDAAKVAELRRLGVTI